MYRAKHDLLTVCNGLVQDGYDIVMITFTLPHKNHDNISTGVKNISKCIRAMLSGEGSNKLRKKYDLLKVSTTKECTFLAPTKQQSTIYLHGAHYHEHAVFSVQRGIDIKELENDLIERWSQIALSQNIITSSQIDDVREHGVRASRVITLADLTSASDPDSNLDSNPDSDSDNSENSENPDEISMESLEKLVAYAIKGIGKYVTTSGKLSKNSGRIDSFTMRNLALSDRPEYLPILAEFMAAIQGVPMFRLSPALRKQYITNIKKEEKYETIYDFNERNWLLTHSSGHSRQLLKVAETEGLGAFAASVNAISRGCDPVTGEELVSDKDLRKIDARLKSCEDHAQADIEPRSALFAVLTPAIDAFYGVGGEDNESCITSEAADWHGAAAERKRAETAAAAEAFATAITDHRQFLEDSYFVALRNTKQARETREEKRKNAEAKRRQAVSPQTQLEHLICSAMQQMFYTDHDFNLELDKMTDTQNIKTNSSRHIDRDLTRMKWMLSNPYGEYTLFEEITTDYDCNTYADADVEQQNKWIEEERSQRYRDRYNYINIYKKVLSTVREHEDDIKNQYIDRGYPGHAAYMRAFGVMPVVTETGRVVPVSDPCAFLSPLVVDGLPEAHADKLRQLYLRHKRNCFRRLVPCLKKVNSSGRRFESTWTLVLMLIRAEAETMSRRGLPILASAV